jgi:transcriptional regulator with XRE-family HTH domain
VPWRPPSGATPFARRLREEREKLGLSQKQVADRIGISQDVLSRIERSEYVGSDATVTAAASALQIDVDDLRRLAEDARDPVVIAINKSLRLDAGGKQRLIDDYLSISRAGSDAG